MFFRKQYRRVVTVDNVYVTAPGKSLVGINTNYQDVATIKNVKVKGDSSKKIKVRNKSTDSRGFLQLLRKL